MDDVTATTQRIFHACMNDVLIDMMEEIDTIQIMMNQIDQN